MSKDLVVTPMPRYTCHKEVWALKIHKVTPQSDGTLLIVPVEEGYAPFEVEKEFVPTHRPAVPQPGWYFVQYDNGYKSFSPGDVFEKGYTRI